MTMKKIHDADRKLIEKAISDGRVRKIPRGETSGWDDIPWKIRRRIAMEKKFKRGIVC